MAFAWFLSVQLIGIGDLFHLDLKAAFLQGEHYNLESRQVVVPTSK